MIIETFFFINTLQNPCFALVNELTVPCRVFVNVWSWKYMLSTKTTFNDGMISSFSITGGVNISLEMGPKMFKRVERYVFEKLLFNRTWPKVKGEWINYGDSNISTSVLHHLTNLHTYEQNLLSVIMLLHIFSKRKSARFSNKKWGLQFLRKGRPFWV